MPDSGVVEGAQRDDCPFLIVRVSTGELDILSVWLVGWLVVVCLPTFYNLRIT